MCICDETITTSSSGFDRLGDAGLEDVRRDRQAHVVGMSQFRVLQPAVALIADASADPPAIGLYAAHATVGALDRRDLGVGVDLGAALVDAAGEAPHDRVVADDPARAVIRSAPAIG